jgi:hypothetical protein
LTLEFNEGWKEKKSLSSTSSFSSILVWKIQEGNCRDQLVSIRRRFLPDVSLNTSWLTRKRILSDLRPIDSCLVAFKHGLACVDSMGEM